jgi:competence protein ComEA
LPGIGDTLAGRIIDYRVKNGPFKRIEDIKNVSGIGEKRYEAIEDMIKV